MKVQTTPTETYEFPGDFQQKLVGMLLKGEDPAENLVVIRPEYFDNPALHDMVAIIHAFYEKYKRVPLPEELLNEIDLLIGSDQRIPVDIYLDTAEKVLEKSEEGSFEYVRDIAREFARFQAIRNAVADSVEIVKQKGDYTPILDKVKQALSVGEEAPQNNLDTVRLSDVPILPVTWLWPGRIPRGKISLIVGDPKVGKSFFTMMIAAHVSTGTPWPTDPSSRVERGSVLILTAEDGLADTVAARLEAHKADRKKIIAIRHVDVGVDGERTFNLLRDVGQLKSEIKKHGDVRLIIIDPIDAYLGAGGGIDSNKNKDVRAVFGPLAELAGQYDVAIIGITHLNKVKSKDNAQNPLYRVMGSIAYTAAARITCLIAKDKGDSSLRHFVPFPGNLSPDDDSLGLPFRIIDGRIKIQDGESSPSVEELLSPSDGTGRSKERAIRFLKEILKGGPADSKEIRQRAKEEEISYRALREAKEELGIESQKAGGRDGKWVWSLPGQSLGKETLPS